MPQPGDGTLRTFLVLLLNGDKRPRDWWRSRAGRPGVIGQPGKLAGAPASRPRLRTRPRPMAHEQYVAPTRAQRVALSE